MENLSGKTAFITGGASGIGLGIAKACAREGMNIVIADLRQKAIDEALPLFQENGWPVHGIQLDVTDREAYAKAADEAEAVFGNIHVLVNNAGIGIQEGPVWMDPYEDVDLMIDVNLKGVLNGIMIFVPRMLKHGEGGHVVSTASKAGLIPVPGFTLYNSTKRAVIAIMETLASDLADTNIGASVFCPGPFQSNLGMTSAEVRTALLGENPPPAAPRRRPPRGETPQVDISKIVRDADEAGERVVRGIKRGDLYIISHVEFKKGLQAR
ncbi:MAG TPA: SDR family NAD(P)-dependent oxidoreductase, partial [Firmicutes bacterium]|nr:SDR family NAD(P)-dependent oxidoreductase [Bacillota bacterium]